MLAKKLGELWRFAKFAEVLFYTVPYSLHNYKDCHPVLTARTSLFRVGIDTLISKAHSIRGTLTLAPTDAGISIILLTRQMFQHRGASLREVYVWQHIHVCIYTS